MMNPTKRSKEKHKRKQEMNEMMVDSDYIRNISIIAHVDHGKTALTESLAHVYMDVGEEKERGITIKSAAVSLQFSRLEQSDSKDDCKQIERPYLINLIDSPGHIDFSPEVTAALRVTDGAICVVDCIAGVSVQTQTVLRQSILERVKPVLFINKIDRIWLEQHLSLEDAYSTFKRTVESFNATCSTYGDSDFGQTVQVDPVDGSVGFGSGYFGYGFTLNDFAAMYCAKFSLSRKKLMSKLWGNWRWSKNQKNWVKLDSKSKKKGKLNGFCQFVLHPLQVLHDSIMEGKSEVYAPILEKLQLDISKKELLDCAKEKDLLRLVMSRWLPARRAVLDLCADHLPSPVRAQKYRIPNLYTGPLDSTEAQSMRACDPNGPLAMYISKMIPTKDPGRFIAFGRVFSGTVKRGEELMILSPNDDAADDEEEKEKEEKEKEHSKFVKKAVQGIVMMMGQKQVKVPSCPAGNICGLLGVDQHLRKSGTLTNSKQVYPFKTMKFSVSSVVKVSVDVVHSKDLSKLVEGLKKLALYDLTLKIERTEQGENVIGGAGELHLETCLNQLREKYMKGSKLKVSNPIVSFAESVEGVTGSSSVLPSGAKAKWVYPNAVSTKSVNKHNHFYMNAEPLTDVHEGDDLELNKLHSLIEDDVLKLRLGDMKSFSKEFVSKFPNWNKTDAEKIWSFGCPPNGKVNVLVDQTKSVQYLDAVRGSAVDGFISSSIGGVLCGEPLRGIRFNLLDAKLHRDPPHRGSGQVTPALKRACYAAQLASSPVLLQPIYEILIDVPHEEISGVYATMGKVRGRAEPMMEAENGQFGHSSMSKMRAYVPVIETFKDPKSGKLGFMDLLRENTKGKAFAMMRFSHWERVDGDPLKEGSLAHTFMMQIRKRKGMKLETPSFLDYNDNLKK